MEVISLTKDKVWKSKYYNKNIYVKKTTRKEVENIEIASKFLKDKKILISNSIYKIIVPKVLSWDGNFMTMEECKGENLELMLRRPEQREEGKKFLNKMMSFMLKQHFYWHDFAPRNILINTDEKEISIVDFERGITIDRELDKKEFMRENVYEEYVAFLLPSERPIDERRIFKIDNDEDFLINIEEIKSNRVKNIAKKMGYSNSILYSQYLNIIYMLIKAEEPFKVNNNIIFPIVELEEILIKDGYNSYINEILEKNNVLIKGEERYE